MENRQQTSEKDIIKRLRDLPLQEVPNDLTDRIMSRIAPSQPGLLRRLWLGFNTTVMLPVRPSYAFGLIILVFGAFLLGRESINFPAMQSPLEPRAAAFEPETARAAYLMGRGLLAAEETDRALPLLQQAAALEPGNPEYAFWEGFGYWKNGNRQQERSSYMRGLSVKPDSIPLLVNLGHNYLSDRKFQQALETYQSVLELSPSEPVALYNRALIYRELHQVEQEKAAWKAYLESNRTGMWSFRAVERLNAYGDFSYRSYLIGVRRLIVSPTKLLKDATSSPLRKAELAPLTRLLAANHQLRLNVVVFMKNDKALAKTRAFEIKKMIIELGGIDLEDRVALSWFDSPEPIKTKDSVEVALNKSVLLFSSIIKTKHKGVAI